MPSRPNPPRSIESITFSRIVTQEHKVLVDLKIVQMLENFIPGVCRLSCHARLWSHVKRTIDISDFKFSKWSKTQQKNTPFGVLLHFGHTSNEILTFQIASFQNDQLQQGKSTLLTNPFGVMLHFGDKSTEASSFQISSFQNDQQKQGRSKLFNNPFGASSIFVTSQPKYQNLWFQVFKMINILKANQNIWIIPLVWCSSFVTRLPKYQHFWFQVLNMIPNTQGTSRFLIICF